MSTATPVAPCDFVVFGGTGDLAVRKLLPALYLRDRDGQLPADTRIIAASRTGLDISGYRDHAQAREIVLLLDRRASEAVRVLVESLTDHITQNAAAVRPLDRVGVLTGDLPSSAQRRVHEIVRTYLANHPTGDGARGARTDRAGRNRAHSVRLGRQHAPGRAPLLPPPGTDLSARVRQLPKQRHPHPQRLARLPARLRTPSALGGPDVRSSSATWPRKSPKTTPTASSPDARPCVGWGSSASPEQRPRRCSPAPSRPRRRR